MHDYCTTEEADRAMREAIRQRLTMLAALDTDQELAHARRLETRWDGLGGADRRGLYRYSGQLVERLLLALATSRNVA